MGILSRSCATLALAAALGPLGSAWASTHGLILAIADYPGPAALPGVKHDVELARKMAHSMGVPDRRLTVIQDGNLDLAGLRATLEGFAQTVRAGDEVFLYFSGHGGRMEVQRIGEATPQCAESFVSADLEFFMDKEFNAWLEGLSTQAAKIVVFADSCHSGGVASAKAMTRSVGASDWRPKTLAKFGPADGRHCEPVNLAKTVVLTRSLRSNVVYVAASQDDEVAWATSRGSAASMAWTECLAQGGVDRDGSGGVTAEELRQCAQSWIDANGFDQNLKLIGNKHMVLGFDSAPQAGAGSRPPAATPQEPASALSSMFDDLLHNGDPKRSVSVRPVRDEVVIGRDPVEFDISTSEPGYLYLLYMGSDGKTVDLLFPNKLDQSNYLEAGTHRFPRAHWRVTAGGPVGTDRILAIVSPVQRNFQNIAAGELGPFSMLVEGGDAKGMRNLSIEALQPSAPSASNCGTRNLSISANQRDCVSAYGADIAAMREVR
ncbi:MAG: DUF4384 domain-containing protein [Thauera phenolivorans]|uniref:DUF4384 domain-containing protein n=1 Tax=Thauera phenolivorans TaxID=1792543 RepID=A0A7X7R7U8_9RHOO|nr:DUF4384 domain-containing protein [Thauera phenolivorans]